MHETEWLNLIESKRQALIEEIQACHEKAKNFKPKDFAHSVILDEDGSIRYKNDVYNVPDIAVIYERAIYVYIVKEFNPSRLITDRESFNAWYVNSDFKEFSAEDALSETIAHLHSCIASKESKGL